MNRIIYRMHIINYNRDHMNISFKHLSLSIVLLSLFANANNQCMLINKLAKKTYRPTIFSLKPNDIKINQEIGHHINKETKDLTSKCLSKALMCLPNQDKNKLTETHTSFHQYSLTCSFTTYTLELRDLRGQYTWAIIEFKDNTWALIEYNGTRVSPLRSRSIIPLCVGSSMLCALCIVIFLSTH